jgi:hypothetical protein
MFKRCSATATEWNSAFVRQNALQTAQAVFALGSREFIRQARITALFC